MCVEVKNKIVSSKSKSGSANYQWEGLTSISSFDKLYHKLYTEPFCDAKCWQDSEKHSAAYKLMLNNKRLFIS